MWSSDFTGVISRLCNENGSLTLKPKIIQVRIQQALVEQPSNYGLVLILLKSKLPN